MEPILLGDFNLDPWFKKHAPESTLPQVLVAQQHLLPHAYNYALSFHPGILRIPTAFCSKGFLQQENLQDRLEPIHNIAVLKAQEAIEALRMDCLLAGVIGSLHSSCSDLPASEMEVYFSEPAVYMSDLSVDCFIMEGFRDFFQYKTCVHTLMRVTASPIAAFFQLKEEKDFALVPQIVEFIAQQDLDLVGFEVTQELLLKWPEEYKNIEIPVGFLLYQDEHELFLEAKVTEMLQVLSGFQPSMFLGGKGISERVWTLCKETLRSL